MKMALPIGIVAVFLGGSFIVYNQIENMGNVLILLGGLWLLDAILLLFSGSYRQYWKTRWSGNSTKFDAWLTSTPSRQFAFLFNLAIKGFAVGIGLVWLGIILHHA